MQSKRINMQIIVCIAPNAIFNRKIYIEKILFALKSNLTLKNTTRNFRLNPFLKFL